MKKSTYSVAMASTIVILIALFSLNQITFSAEKNTGAEKSSGHNDDHDDHGDHEEKDDHDDHDDHADEALKLSAKNMKELKIKVMVAGPGELTINTRLTGEVRLNEERLAHVVPNIAGVVRDVKASLGDTVKAGDLMAVLASRELAETKAAHLAAHAQLDLIEVTFRREKQLWEDKISAEQDFLRAKNAVAKARIELRASEQRLYALGVTKKAIHNEKNESNSELTRFEVRAPFGGTVIEKHITLGEAIKETSPIFVIADLSTVWVDLSVYAKDLLSVRKGQKVLISTDVALPDVEGTIAYIGPMVGEETRTALARIILPNAGGLWRPGMFVTAKVMVDERKVAIKVPKTALLTIDGKTKVFIQDEDGFEAVEVVLGRVDREGAEVMSGLKAGQQYVATGGFYLKAELAKEAFAGGGHNH